MRPVRIQSADRASSIELRLVDDDPRSIGPTLGVRLSSHDFAGADDRVIFHEVAWRSFLEGLDAPDGGRIQLVSAAYFEGGEGLELEISSTGPDGPFRIRSTLKRHVLVGLEWATHRVDTAFELDVAAMRRAAADLRALVPV